MANQYATWNPGDKEASISLSGGNLIVGHDGSTSFASVRSTIGKSSGKWYWEITDTTDDGAFGMFVAVANSSASIADNTFFGGDANGWGYANRSGGFPSKWNGSGPVAYGALYTTGDVIGVALDMDSGTVEMFKNNVSQGVMYTGLTGTIYAGVSTPQPSSVVTANFGESPMAYTAPTGFNQGLYEEVTFPTSGLIYEWLMQANANTTIGSANLTTSGITFGTVDGKLCATYATNGYGYTNSVTMPSDITVSFWMHLDDFNNTQYLLKHDGSLPAWYIALRPSESTEMIVYSAYGSNDYASILRSALTANTWINITVTRTVGNMTSYLNGVQYATTGIPTGISSAANGFNLGGYNTDSGVNPHGSLREARIWNRVLTPAEVMNVYLSDADVPASNTSAGFFAFFNS